MSTNGNYKFDAKRHVHTLDGKRLHGVTSVLKMWGDPGGLIQWAANCAVDAIEAGDEPDEARKAYAKKRDKAGDVGTQVHKQLEDYFNGVEGDYLDVVYDIADWALENTISFKETEAHVHSKEHWYGGICDGIVEKDGKTFILDFKTSGTVQTKYFYQMGAYSLAWKEMNWYKPTTTHFTTKEGKKVSVHGKEVDPEFKGVDGVVIVHIPRGRSFNPEKNVYWRYDVEALESAWLNILNTYKLDKDIQKLIKY